MYNQDDVLSVIRGFLAKYKRITDANLDFYRSLWGMTNYYTQQTDEWKKMEKMAQKYFNKKFAESL